MKQKLILIRKLMKNWRRRLLLCPAICIWMAGSVFSQKNSVEKNTSGLAERFQMLTRESMWTPETPVRLQFPTYHTQGMTRAGEDFFLSTVEIRERPKMGSTSGGFDRTPGSGRGHLIRFKGSGIMTDSVILGEGDIYHPGGIDFDGEYIWVPVAEYRPESRSIIYKVHPGTLEAIEVFRFPDHIGAVVCDPEQNILYGYSWGSRKIYSWNLDLPGEEPGRTKPEDSPVMFNRQHYIDYQDCQYIRNRKAICSGLSTYTGENGSRFALGGLDLIDLESLSPVHLLPVERYTGSKNSRVMTQNPFYAEITGSGIRFYFIPEDDRSFLYGFEVGVP